MSVGGILSSVGQSLYRTVTTNPVTSGVVGVAGSALAIGVAWNLRSRRELSRREVTVSIDRSLLEPFSAIQLDPALREAVQKALTGTQGQTVSVRSSILAQLAPLASSKEWFANLVKVLVDQAVEAEFEARFRAYWSSLPASRGRFEIERLERGWEFPNCVNRAALKEMIQGSIRDVIAQLDQIEERLGVSGFASAPPSELPSSVLPHLIPMVNRIIARVVDPTGASRRAEIEAIVGPLLRSRPTPASSSSAAPPIVEARPSLIDWRGAPDQAKRSSIQAGVAEFVGDLRVTKEEFAIERLGHFSTLNFEALKRDLRGQPVSEAALALLDQIERLERSPGVELFRRGGWCPSFKNMDKLSLFFDSLLSRSGFERLAYLIKNELLPQAKELLDRLPEEDQKEALRGYIEKMEFPTPISLSAFAALLDEKDGGDRFFLFSYLKFLQENGVARPDWASKVDDVYRLAFNGGGNPVSGYAELLIDQPFSPFEAASLTIRLLEAVAPPQKRRESHSISLRDQFAPLLQTAGTMRGLDEDYVVLLCQLSDPTRWASLRSSWYMHSDHEARFSQEGRDLLASIQRLREAPGSEEFRVRGWIEKSGFRTLPQIYPFFESLVGRSQLESERVRLREELLPEAAQLYNELPEGERRERLGEFILRMDRAQKGTLLEFAQEGALFGEYQALLWEIRIEGAEQEKAVIPRSALFAEREIPSDLFATASLDYDPYEGAELTVRVWEVMKNGLKAPE